ncbi:MAG TPA: hypothetical protein VIY52_26070 [Streptosporangiaceae bacterium]
MSLQVSEFDPAEQLDHVVSRSPVASHSGLCLRLQGRQPVLQALLDGVVRRSPDTCGKFGARKLLTYVFYAMRDGHVRALDTPAAEHEAR